MGNWNAWSPKDRSCSQCPLLSLFSLDPDIACYAKLLTGGIVPMSVTLASEEVFNTYLGDEKSQALLHGHSYTAHPIGCVSALQALDSYNAILERDDHDSKSGPRMLFDVEQTKALSCLSLVEQSFTLGTVLAVTIKPEDGTGGYGASGRTVPIVQSLRQDGVFARPLGNVIYIMASPLTSREECARLTAILYKTIQKFGEGAHIQNDSEAPRTRTQGIP
jgi:dethiobiotin synthetase/adenosylmethionine--8-amino-7-oxononanoate aminotransferase